MKVKGIGINAHPARIDGEIRKLEEDLKFFQEVGYDYVEIPVDAIDVVYRGRLLPRRLRALKELLSRFELNYTVHAPLALDLRTREDHELQLELFRSSLYFTAEIGAEIFVYHYGRKGDDPDLEELLYQGISEMASYAAELGVLICVENIEIDPMQNVVDFVRQVAKESVGMTLDLGHGYLAAGYFGFDFLEAVRQARPYVRHIHISDNFGRFEETRLVSYELYKQIPYRRRLALGKGDLHLPPGWGEVPWEEALRLLKGYEGVLTLEYYHHRYLSEARDILSKVKAELQKIKEQHSEI
jgi:sugar phosphate isomerase/epimerase